MREEREVREYTREEREKQKHDMKLGDRKGKVVIVRVDDCGLM